eukprot:14932835-Alexandrium_andersonii.AAC.1
MHIPAQGHKALGARAWQGACAPTHTGRKRHVRGREEARAVRKGQRSAGVRRLGDACVQQSRHA